ncbi:hypothetical protein Bca4012_051136 [Brassica carinata]|uniref:Uncharacterized protein n=1 Tax=Brassica carinata TaxID=52824 RepID=A0A8X7R9L2_BRACI|nr:hypothetical protein Bca52824_053793 [Brassica carinata]
MIREDGEEVSLSEIISYIHISLLCVDDNQETRPSLETVIHWFCCFSSPLLEPETCPSLSSSVTSPVTWATDFEYGRLRLNIP